MNEKIIITGAGGFIGSHITRFFLENGHRPFCLVRSSRNCQNLDGLDVNIIEADIRDRAALDRIMKGSTCIVHTAGMVRDWGRREDFYEINVIGTRNVIEAAYLNNCNEIIITGSVSSYGEEDYEGIKSEEYPYNSHYPYLLDRIFPCAMNHYRDSKALCTEKAIKMANDLGINLAVIEPVWVYGEREFNTGFYNYLSAVKNGLRYCPGSAKNKFHVIYAEDLARAYYLAFSKKLKGIHRIIVGNSRAERMDDIYRIFCESAGLKKPRSLPKCLAGLPAFLMELFYTLFRADGAPTLTRGRLNMFYDNIEYSTEKASRLLSFQNKYSLREGIERTVKWYQVNKLI